jgi:hypothetical protein
MDKLMQIKECLIGVVEEQVYGKLDKVDAKELGEVVDMIKDIAETEYYCAITEAMKGDEEGYKSNPHGTMYYSPMKMREHYPMEHYDPRYRERYPYDTMYAQNGGMSDGSSSNGGSAGSSSSRYYHEGMMRRHEPMEYEGRSGERRRMYMEGKHTKDKTQQMKELESYMQELSTDITEMIQDASPEEKALLQ